MNTRGCIDVNSRGDKNCVPIEKKRFIFTILLVTGIICVTSFLWVHLIALVVFNIGQAFLLLAFYAYVVPWMVIVGIVLVLLSILVKIGFFDKPGVK